MKRLILLFVGALWLVGCASAGTATPTAVANVPATAEDVSAEAPPVSDTDAASGLEAEPRAERENTAVIREEVTFNGATGLTMHGTLWFPTGQTGNPAVLLLHMLNSQRSAWDSFAPQLAEQGYAVLAIDMRGHGETSGGRDWQLAEKDLRLSWDYLATRPEADVSRRAVVGASIGANMALRNMAFMAEIDTAVLLSPGLDYQGVRTDNTPRDIANRPVLILASREDNYAAQSSETLAGLLTGSRLELYEGIGHGTAMLGRGDNNSPVEATIIEWLNAVLISDNP